MIEYLVLEAFSQNGPLNKVRAKKLTKSWETLQEALDELGTEGWELNNLIYGPTGAYSQNGDHFCEAFVLKRKK